MTVTDWYKGQPMVVTEEHLKARWGGGRPGERFRCYLCGHRFEVGDRWRWQFTSGRTMNFMVCGPCDGPDVVERWEAFNDELDALCERAWWFVPRAHRCQDYL